MCLGPIPAQIRHARGITRIVLSRAIEYAAAPEVTIAVIEVNARHAESAVTSLGWILGNPIEELLALFVKLEDGHYGLEAQGSDLPSTNVPRSAVLVGQPNKCTGLVGLQDGWADIFLPQCFSCKDNLGHHCLLRGRRLDLVGYIDLRPLWKVINELGRYDKGRNCPTEENKYPVTINSNLRGASRGEVGKGVYCPAVCLDSVRVRQRWKAKCGMGRRELLPADTTPTVPQAQDAR
mmetsp:Transcript_1280/g.2991  ORF Transcript_1280/g.2991 Transcript_1280/m.2991 type:complete len:236 (-) Transcript_1280:2812-3519(-)